jgi:hypothetical protein
MKPRQFDQLLEEVHSAIRDAESLDAKGRELLEHLERDISDLLERSEKERRDLPINQRLSEAIGHFEVTHPTLTTLLSELSTILSNAGI